LRRFFSGPCTEMPATFLVGDVHDRLAELDDDSVDLILSSPPFLALRSYLPADHPDKGKEIGSEPDPGVFVDVLCGVVDDLVRVLAPHGSICFELGDTYAGGLGFQGVDDFAVNKGRQYWITDSGTGPLRDKAGNGWPRPKSLALVPELFRITLAYGRNPLTGKVWWEGTERWMVRNVVRWVRPNPPVGALGDKFRPATSELVVFTRSPKRFFDLDAVRTEAQVQMGRAVQGNNIKGSDEASFRFAERIDSHPAGAPPLDWWKISPKGYPGAHYATFPDELCVVPIKSMCPERVCRTCGEPSRRIVERSRPVEPDDSQRIKHANGERPAPGRQDRAPEIGWEIDRETVGWSDCGHDDWRRGMVLDPFAGTGTTLAVATGHGRDAIGIDLDESNADLAIERVGPLMLEVV